MRPVTDIPFIDPWWDLYLPATFGEVDAVLDALEAAELVSPVDERGDLYAIAARALLVLGRFVEAERLSELAFAAGGAEAEALATFTRGDGHQRAELRMRGRGRAGLRADAACDLAALHLAVGDTTRALAAVRRARALCPGHSEAGRWGRLLEEGGDLRGALEGARDPRRTRGAPAGPLREAAELLPTRRTGWLSTERYVRRLLAGGPASGWAPPHTALGRLQDAGVSTLYFALDSEYTRVGFGHPLVALELAADEVRAIVEEGRDARAHAARLWTSASLRDHSAMEDAAQLLVGLATNDVRLTTIGAAALAWLSVHCPARTDLWDGYRCVLASAGAPELALARELARRRPAEPMAWRMAVESLRRAGQVAEAEEVARAGRCEPALYAMAIDVLDAPGSFRMVVSGRLTPRWGRGGVAGASAEYPISSCN